MGHIYGEDYDAFNDACDAHYRKLQNVSTKHGIHPNPNHETEIECDDIDPEEELDFENYEKILYNLRNR